MLLSVFTRHTPQCPFKASRHYRRCNCPKWIGGQIHRAFFRQSARTWQWGEAEAYSTASNSRRPSNRGCLPSIGCRRRRQHQNLSPLCLPLLLRRKGTLSRPRLRCLQGFRAPAARCFSPGNGGSGSVEPIGWQNGLMAKTAMSDLPYENSGGTSCRRATCI
jgi:hypothetical protein